MFAVLLGGRGPSKECIIRIERDSGTINGKDIDDYSQPLWHICFRFCFRDLMKYELIVSYPEVDRPDRMKGHLGATTATIGFD